MKTRLLKKLRRKFSREFKVWESGGTWYLEYGGIRPFGSERYRDDCILSIINNKILDYIKNERCKRTKTKPRHPYFW